MGVVISVVVLSLAPVGHQKTHVLVYKMFKDKLKNAIQKVENKTNQLIELIQVEEDIRTTRLNICDSCEYLFAPTGNCKKCGCFVKAKTWLKDTTCPLNKW
jgi:hypothetical protein